MDEHNTLINLSGIAFGYDAERPVFDGLDLRLREGERMGLAGPNGSGKTTLLHIIVGLLRPRSGRVEVFGTERTDETAFAPVREKVGLLFQNPEDQLFCPTVAEDVAFGPLNLGKTHAEATGAVRRTLEALGLGGFEDRITHHLSEGEKKLVALATVLAMEPDVLLLDEPTAGLDEATKKRVVEIIAGLDKSLIIVSHDAALLETACTSRLALRDGRIGPA
jgi:cobalt/nickel transport system ATP-binding protein